MENGTMSPYFNIITICCARFTPIQAPSPPVEPATIVSIFVILLAFISIHSCTMCHTSFHVGFGFGFGFGFSLLLLLLLLLSLFDQFTFYLFSSLSSNGLLFGKRLVDSYNYSYSIYAVVLAIPKCKRYYRFNWGLYTSNK